MNQITIAIFSEDKVTKLFCMVDLLRVFLIIK